MYSQHLNVSTTASNYIIVSNKPFILMMGGVKPQVSDYFQEKSVVFFENIIILFYYSSRHFLCNNSRSTLSNQKHILNIVLSLQCHTTFTGFIRIVHKRNYFGGVSCKTCTNKLQKVHYDFQKSSTQYKVRLIEPLCL